MQPDAVALVSPLASQDARSFVERDIFEEIERHVGPRNFEHWFRGKATLTFTEGELILGIGSSFLLTWMQKNFREQMASVARRFLGDAAQARFEVDPRVALIRPTRNPAGIASGAAMPPSTSASAEVAANDSPSVDAPAADVPSTPTILSEPPAIRADSGKSRGGGGGRRFADLADFVPGPCNELALMAARQVGESPGERFNPLYLHGNSGVGKTHLLEGIYRMIRKRHATFQVLYLTSEDFANHFTQALREHKLPGFRQRFRGVDVLLVDDVDFFDGKRAIQEEFLHTIQQLESHGRQVVVSSDRHPRLLTKVSENLTSRLVSGLVCRLEPPDFETRLKIVECKAASLPGVIAPEALAYVAQRFRNNVRELVGALHCFESYHALTRKRISLATARLALADLERDGLRTVRIPDVEESVCRFFGVEARDLRSPSRQRSLSEPRMLAMFLIRKHTHAAYSEIGNHFGGRNHSTVIAAEKRVRGMISAGAPMHIGSRSWQLEELIDAIEQQLQAG